MGGDGFNLPPGVSVNDIPGNTPAEEAMSKLYEAILDAQMAGLTSADLAQLWSDAEKEIETWTSGGPDDPDDTDPLTDPGVCAYCGTAPSASDGFCERCQDRKRGAPC